VNAPPPDRVCPIITRANIAAVCTATNDPSPLHLDDDFARAAGYPSVVVPGTLLLGWIGDYLAQWAGDPRSIEFWEVRFVSPLWLNDQVTLQGRWDNGSVEVSAVTQDGRRAARATARFKECRS
jgi:acyl dehydratase